MKRNAEIQIEESVKITWGTSKKINRPRHRGVRKAK